MIISQQRSPHVRFSAARQPLRSQLLSIPGLFSFPLILLILLVLPANLPAAPGECSLDFLNIPIGAYGASLGNGGFARIEGPQALFYNPSLIGSNTAGFASYQRLLLDTRSEAVAIGLPVGGNLVFGAGAHFFQPGNIDGYDANDVSIGKIKSGDFLIRMSIARVGELSYGISFSFYGQRLDDQVGRGIGIGFGLSRDFAYGRLSLTADNFGPDFKIGTGSAPLPQRYSVSAWIPLTKYWVNVTFDLSYKPYLGFKPSGGIEYSPLNGFALRAGTNGDTPVAFGLGLNRDKIGLDYTYFPSGIFGGRHIVSFSVSK